MELVKDKDAYSVNDSITLGVKFSLSGEMRDVFNEKNWTDAYEKNDNQFKLKYGIKLVSSGLRKHDVVKPIDTYRKASIFWTRNPKLVNPVKEKRIWVQVAKNFEPIIKLTEEDVQKELFDFDESVILSAAELGKGKHKISAEGFVSWNKHTYIEKNEEKMHSEEIEIEINYGYKYELSKLAMAKYDGLLGQPLLEVEEPDKEGGVTLIFKDNRFMFIKLEDGKLSTISIPE